MKKSPLVHSKRKDFLPQERRVSTMSSDSEEPVLYDEKVGFFKKPEHKVEAKDERKVENSAGAGK